MSQASPAPKRAEPPRKRTRTGCLKCRQRRRKCDEGKPKCQNCISKNFECRYANPVTFLAKNAYTVLESSKPEQIPTYTNLTLINSTSPATRGANPSPHHVSFQTHAEVDIDPQNTPTDLPHEGLDQIPPGDSYESALHGLIALGSRNSALQSPSPARHLPVPIHSTNDISADLMLEDARLPISGFSIPDHLPGQDDFPSMEVDLSEKRVLDLLRYFRYEVAPWLDICDVEQDFGLVLPRLAMESPALRYAVLALSSQSMTGTLQLPKASTNNQARAYLQLMKSHLSEETNPLAWFACSVLSVLVPLLHDMPGAWKEELLVNANPADLPNWPQDYSTGLGSSFLWLWLRLELGKGLAESSPVTIPPVVETALREQMINVFEQGIQYTHQAILYCVEAANVCWGGPEISHPETPRRPLVERWQHLYDELERWYNFRPVEFLPIVDLEVGRGPRRVENSAFPVIIFTNGGSILGNQLHHTAMLILLLHKPRTLRLSAVSSYTSPLWHAERLCGIALSNSHRETWDPCLLASLLLAARRMTHGSQQQALLDGFERIRTLTGFDAGFLLNDLRGCWGPVALV